MDTQTLSYMRKRVTEADILNKQIAEARRLKGDLMSGQLALCLPTALCNWYPLSTGIPQEARDIIIHQVDERIADLEKKLAEI
jgi:hypothetical protein